MERARIGDGPSRANVAAPRDGLCECGCGQKTQPARQTDSRLGNVKGEPQRFVRGHQLRGALEKRWTSTSRDRAARQRVCGRAGCKVEFCPTSGQLRRGVGLYCSVECAGIAKRRHPVPEIRVCARPGCATTFRPAADKAANGGGRYCSPDCVRRDRWRFSRARTQITCAHCGATKIVKSPYYVGRQRFCSRRCWGRSRWKTGQFPIDLVIKTWWSTHAWRHWEGRFYGKAGGGRPRSAERSDYETTLERIRTLYEETHGSERELARRTGESRRMVRLALGRPV
jgi:hypothetical protein